MFRLPLPLSNAQLQLIFKNMNNLITLLNVFFRSHISEYLMNIFYIVHYNVMMTKLTCSIYLL